MPPREDITQELREAKVRELFTSEANRMRP